MSTRIRSIRFVFAALATAALAAGMLVLAPAASAVAATGTYISLHPVVAPVAGQQVTMQVYTGSLAGNFPAGEVDVMVEGTGMMEGENVSTSDGGAQLNIGNFPIGTITVDASFTPKSTLYAPTSTKTSVTITGASDSVRPVFPAAPRLGAPVTTSVILFLGSGNTHAPGGVIGFTVDGVSVGSCTPAPTGAVANWSCSATLPAPTRSGPYSVTADFGRSTYYLPSSGTATATIATAPAAPVVASAPATTTPTPAPTATPEATLVTKDAQSSDPHVATSASTDIWAWLFLAAVLLLIAAGVVVLVLLRRRSLAP